MRVFVALALCVPLCGCFSLTGPKPLPEWAMNPQQVTEAPAAKPRRTVAQRQPREVQEVQKVDIADSAGTIVGSPSYVRPAGLAKDGAQPARSTQPREITPFGAEWKAREDAADEKLRRSMTICRGC